MEKSSQENPIERTNSSTELESGWKEKLEEENKEVSALYDALYKKTLEVFGKEEINGEVREVNEQWRKIVKDYDDIQQEPDKEKRDGLLKSFLNEKMKELEEIEKQKEKESETKES